MPRDLKLSIALYLFPCLLWSAQLFARSEQVVDIPTRPGVTQRMVVLSPDRPRAAVVLFSGGDGGLRITPAGHFDGGSGNFLVRSRSAFAAQGLLVVVVDAPSDRQSAPYLSGFRQRPEHADDIKAVIAWVRQQAHVPVWLVGTSRGTQSAAYVATQLPQNAGGPDGLVLTSTILTDPKGRPVPDMPLGRLRIPTLIVHHQEDACPMCDPAAVPRLMDKLTSVPRKELILVDGGIDKGDPCEAMAHHGFNGIEVEVVTKITRWIFQ